MSFTCDNCGEKVGRATGATGHEFKCESPDPPLCESGRGWPRCLKIMHHRGLCTGEYDAAAVERTNRARAGR